MSLSFLTSRVWIGRLRNLMIVKIRLDFMDCNL